MKDLILRKLKGNIIYEKYTWKNGSRMYIEDERTHPSVSSDRKIDS